MKRMDHNLLLVQVARSQSSILKTAGIKWKIILLI